MVVDVLLFLMMLNAGGLLWIMQHPKYFYSFYGKFLTGSFVVVNCLTVSEVYFGIIAKIAGI